MRATLRVIGAATLATLAACSGGTTTNPVFIVPTPAPVVQPPSTTTNALTVTSSQLSFTTVGTTLSFSANENSYTGAFTASSGTPSCGGIATFTPVTSSGPAAAITVTSITAGTCQLIVKDAADQQAAVSVTVTTTGGSVSIAR